MMATRTYLDWNATAPLHPDARRAALSAMDVVGNPSSVHSEGRRARRIVEDAREDIAALVGAAPSEVIFTSGASEANATVIASGWPTILASAIEHDSVRAPAAKSGAAIVALPVASDGRVSLETVAALIGLQREGVGGLLSLQLANNETGVVQAVGGIAALARNQGFRVHTDAVQAAGRIDCNMARLGVDYLSLSSHKLGGPKGAGALIVRNGAPIAPLLSGGGQERRLRAGTENVAAIAGFGAAARAAGDSLKAAAAIGQLRDRLERVVLAATPEAVVIGADVARLPNTSCIALPGRSSELLVTALDLAGIAVSAGAACSSGKVSASHVLSAMGVAPEIAGSAIRLSLGPTTTVDDIAAFAAAWTTITAQAARAA